MSSHPVLQDPFQYCPIYAWVFQVAPFLYVFSTKSPIYISHLSICATCPACLILFDLITQIILGENYTSWHSLLYSFLQSPVTSSLLDPNTFLRTLSLSSSLISRHKISHPYMQQTKLWICMLYVCINIQGSDVGIDRLWQLQSDALDSAWHYSCVNSCWSLF